MKCLDKKRIKMKQGETLALNERIMLSLVSTGVSITILFSFFLPYNVKAFAYNPYSINSVVRHEKLTPTGASPWFLQCVWNEKGKPNLLDQFGSCRMSIFAAEAWEGAHFWGNSSSHPPDFLNTLLKYFCLKLFQTTILSCKKDSFFFFSIVRSYFCGM